MGHTASVCDSGTVIKVVSFFKRRAGLSVDAFQEHWRTRHAELVVQLPGIRRYLQNHTLPSGYKKKEPDFDGVAEAWFDDTQALRVSGASDAYRAVKADEENFIRASSIGSVLTNEIVILEGLVPPDPVKMIAFLNKLPDLPVDRFQSYWRESHGPLASKIPGLLRYTQCHTHWGIYDAGRSPAYDGVPISYFADLEAMSLAGGSEEYEATRADEANFMISGRLPFVIANEVEIEI